MHKKIAYFLLIIVAFNLLVAGCQNTAQQKPKKPSANQEIGMSDSERRVMASKISNLSEEVEGVERASVIIARANITDMGFIKNTGNTSSSRPNNNFAVNNSNSRPNTYSNYGNNIVSDSTINNPNGNYPDINSQNINTVTDDNNRNMAAPGGGVIVLIGASVNESVRNDSEVWNKTRNVIIEKAKSSDVNISQVYVTAEPETVGRIDSIAASMLQGEPGSKYEDDIKDILAKIKEE